jgi:hypothetical protein
MYIEVTPDTFGTVIGAGSVFMTTNAEKQTQVHIAQSWTAQDMTVLTCVRIVIHQYTGYVLIPQTLPIPKACFVLHDQTKQLLIQHFRVGVLSVKEEGA